ncbi:DUF1214 domain-containing protein [Achromobacter xylosoxidans]|uniref:DUF1214 domain-containing protein n=1 Tax=Alcaligenes xylosoxydans xylosoxydans TaxID=85698 RepID=UPI0022B921B0|nr:DUF1214 domain-containing protein [Achromobacter xylosoxidans]MCZ8392595.1 DUF1214 domain-containing protein [Achromobacter xylosoxidans]
MHMSRRSFLAMLAASAALPSSWPASAGYSPDENAIEQAYLYLLGRALVIRQEHVDRGGEGFAYNQIKYNPLGSADFVNPNFDVAYLEAWFAVDDRTPVILTVPAVTGRYYTAQILDEWGEVIVNINERTFPSRPSGRFGLVAPGWEGSLPADVARIELHSRKAKMLGRVELKGDPDGAVKLQRQFQATALGQPVIAAPPYLPTFGNKDLIGAEIFDDVDARMGSAFDVSPIAAQMQQQVRAVAAHVASSPQARMAVDRLLRERVVPRFIDYAFTKSAPYRNHWVGGGKTGNYGADYRLRTVVNYAGIWANTTDEVIYFVATRDANEQPLTGAASYVIHFPADKLPQSVVDAYWSVILVGVPDYRVVQNELKRYNFNSDSDLRKEADGSLKIAIGPQPVAGVPQSNWLPAPKDKPFSLTFRTYVPKDAVKTGDWAPPPVTRL